MKLTLGVSFTDGRRHQVTTNLFAVVAWERKYKRKASDLAQGIGIEDLAFLAYESSKAHDIVVPVVFDDYVKSLDNIDVVGSETENPTDAAPGDDN